MFIKNILSPFRFDLQLFAGDGSESGSSDTWDFEDNHGRTYTLPVSMKQGDAEIPLKELFGHAIAKERKNTRTTIETQFKGTVDKVKEYEDKITTLTAQIEELQTKGGGDKKTNEEITRLQKKLDDEKKRLEGESSSNFALFKNEKITNEVLRAMTGYELNNMEDTAELFMRKAKVELVKDEDGKFKTVVKITLPDDKGEYRDYELSPKDAFKKWIELQSNAYLLKNKMTPGGGGRRGAGASGADGKLIYSREELRDPKIQKEYYAKMREGIPVSIQQ